MVPNISVIATNSDQWRTTSPEDALACSEPPEGYARWSLLLLADRPVELGYGKHRK
jgi:hypothetical protein